MSGIEEVSGDGGVRDDPGLAPFEGGGRAILWGLVIGVIGLGLVIIGATIDPRQAAFSYLMAFIFWHTIAFGALVHLMIQHAINASWAIVLRRVGEGVATTFPILLILALPLTIGLDLIFPWTEPVGALPDHPDLRARIVHRGAYLNTTFFYLRAGAYFAVWILIAWLLQRWTLRQFEMDGGPGGPRGRSLAQAQRVLSALTLPLMAFVITFAAIDWVMSLEPEWSSTILGVYYYAGSALAFTAVLTLLSLAVQRAGYLEGVVTLSHYHALGKLMLVFVSLWGYFAFVQLLLIWLADIPREVEWFVVRTAGSWKVGAWILVLGHFGLSFFALLSWRAKRHRTSLAIISIWIITMHFIDIYWLIMPALYPGGARPHWLDLTSLLGIGGLLLAYGVWRFRGRPVAPVGDPRYERSLTFYTT